MKTRGFDRDIQIRASLRLETAKTTDFEAFLVEIRAISGESLEILSSQSTEDLPLSELGIRSCFLFRVLPKTDGFPENVKEEAAVTVQIPNHYRCF
ncbi:hypothetical protein MRB53_030178 [Persea americana]|uniref:Uncharacterized protein n=1 Tax=Persea americana TaxID=3435 RepID=A0ACC2KKF7_PERAE|nr:hypothetical protein MRB53_030178 [Persea americana]